MNFTDIVKDDYIPATSLGGFTKGVSALEMAAAFATLENDGMYRQPTCIKSIIDADENIVYASQQTEVVIYDKTASRMMTDVLTTVMTSGTGRRLNLTDMPCAGKTGTTNDHKDGWFVGYTRYYTTSVWVGCDYPKEIKDLSGSSYPGQIWQTYMNAIHEGLTPMEFLPYAQLSDEFVDQMEQEQKEQEERREEGQNTPGQDETVQNPEDDGQQNPPEDEETVLPDEPAQDDGTGEENQPDDNNTPDNENGAENDNPEDGNENNSDNDGGGDAGAEGT